MRATNLLLGAVVWAGVACAGDGSGVVDPNDDDNGGNGGGTGFAATVQPIFTASCALSGCHAGSSPAMGMNLSDGQAYANIVNVPAAETVSSSGLMRVLPDFPDQSYRVLKFQGTHTQAGVDGSGGRMPLGGLDALTQAQIDAIRQWISDGATNN